jgi:hypothetical protein
MSNESRVDVMTNESLTGKGIAHQAQPNENITEPRPLAFEKDNFLWNIQHVPDVLYLKLKSSAKFEEIAAKKKYNQPGFLKHLFSQGEFAFDPQFSTAKLDYSFTEHKNLTELGIFFVKENASTFQTFAAKAK